MTDESTARPTPSPAVVCLKCGHNDVAYDGLCAALVPLIDKEPHGSQRCRCVCVFQPPPEQTRVAAEKVAEKIVDLVWQLYPDYTALQARIAAIILSATPAAPQGDTVKEVE